MAFSPLRSLLLTILALLTVAAPAAAGVSQESVFQDDRILLNPDTRDRALDELDALGVDTIRVLVIWRSVAPSAGSKNRPDFDAADPAAYGDGFARYDDLVRGAAARGMSVLMTPTAPIPDWASQCTRTRSRCKPKTAEFGKFVQALGTRYSGSWPPAPPAPPGGGGGGGGGGEPSPLPIPIPFGDTAGSGTASAQSEPAPNQLPRVSSWSVWNEPNLSSWLVPQVARSGGRRIRFAARRYRELFRAAARALAATGHGEDRLLMGELAPIGRTGATAPVEFLREVLCLDSRRRAYRGAAAKARGCRSVGRLPATGLAHHPYTFAASAAPGFRGRSQDATISSLGRLTAVLDAGARARRVARRLPIFLTEFGFQTNPPDRFTRTTPARQAAYINESEWIAFRNPRVASFAQYQLVDEPDARNFNTGLRFTDGRAKPALAAYALPLVVTRSGSGSRVFGAVRPAADGAAERVRIQRAPAPGQRYRTLATVGVNRKGYLLRRVKARGGVWRLAWKPSGGGATRHSRVVFSR